MGISRAVVDTINDSPFMQTMGAKIMGGEASSDIEHVHPFGMTAYPMGKTTDEQAKGGMMKGAAEVLVMGLMGNRSHPMAMPAADRRFRPNGMKAGETVFHDAFKQFTHFGKDAVTTESPKKVVIRVAKEKQQQGEQSPSTSGQSGQEQKKNNGADVAGEKDVPVGLTFHEDGSWELIATKPGKIKLGDVTWHFEAGGLRQEGGSYVKHDDRNIGKTHKHGQVQPGGGQTGDPLA